MKIATFSLPSLCMASGCMELSVFCDVMATAADVTSDTVVMATVDAISDGVVVVASSAVTLFCC